MQEPEWQGLSHEEARRRLAAQGQNSLPQSQRRMAALLLHTVREPMFLLLLGAAALYLALGDWQEGAALLVMAALTIGLALFQEGRTERALQALRDLSSPRALVLREGRALRIAGSEVVEGDLLLLAEGDRVAADALLLQATGLRVDESQLTGESMAVSKCPAGATQAPAAPGGDGMPFVWSGSLVLQGDGLARVSATGPRTELGKIGSSLQAVGSELSPMQRDASRMTRLMALAGVVVSLLAVVLYGLQGGGWLAAVLAGIALSMSLLPAEFPVIMTVFLAIGAWRLARVQVLTRRLPSIEALGSITVL